MSRFDCIMYYYKRCISTSVFIFLPYFPVFSFKNILNYYFPVWFLLEKQETVNPIYFKEWPNCNDLESCYLVSLVSYNYPLTACPFTLCRGFFTPKIVGTFYMQGYKVKEKTAIVPHCTSSFKTQWAP